MKRSGVALDDQTELEFRRWYLNYVRKTVRASIWLPLLIVTAAACAPGPFAAWRAVWFAGGHALLADIVRFGFILPWFVVLMVVVYTPLYQRWYVLTARVLAPIHGLCIVAFDILARTQQYSLTSWMVLTVLGAYFMYGLLLRHAVRTVVIVLTGYIVASAWTGLIDTQWYVDLVALLFGATFGGFVSYWLHQSVRVNFRDNRRLTDRVHRDALTGIFNRRMFDEHLQRLWQQAARGHASLGLLIVDIDYFKNYNDSLGHQAGDECLSRIANLLATAAHRPLDVATRYGGEEFGIVFYDCDRPTLEATATHLRTLVLDERIRHPSSPVQPFVTVSVGGACVVASERRSVNGFIQLADEALYAAKKRGRNRIVIMDREYDSLSTGVFRSFKVSADATL